MLHCVFAIPRSKVLEIGGVLGSKLSAGVCITDSHNAQLLGPGTIFSYDEVSHGKQPVYDKASHVMIFFNETRAEVHACVCMCPC